MIHDFLPGMTDWTVTSEGLFDPGGRAIRAALGKAGVLAESDKREGDKATPLGRWPVRRVLYRADRGPAPDTALPVRAIREDDGWCDAPDDPAYNRPVRLPYPASAESLMREDGLYDIVVILGHNDDPPAPGAGSAIFMHCARPDYGPTLGCVALAKPDLLDLLKAMKPGDTLGVIME